MDKTIIMVAPNGAKKTKQDLPQIPLSPQELAIEAKNCANAGASIYHLHVRDKNQGHTLDVGIYAEAIAAIKKQAGDNIIIQATTENVGIYSPPQQMQMVYDLKPEAISAAIREFIPTPEYEAAAKDFFHWVSAENIWPQFILYSPEEIKYFGDLKKRGIIPEKNNFVLLVLGKKQKEQTKDAFAKPQDLDPYLAAVKETGLDLTWAICAFGGYENECMKYAVSKGGHARIGFENNHWLADESTAPSNAALVEQFVKTSGVKPISAPELRKIMP